jgi:hypothetical protein
MKSSYQYISKLLPIIGQNSKRMRAVLFSLGVRKKAGYTKRFSGIPIMKSRGLFLRVAVCEDNKFVED